MIRAGDVILLCVLSLLCLGVVMVQSAGMNVGEGASQASLASILLSRSVLYAALAMGALLIATRIPLDRIMKARGIGSPAPWLMIIMLVGCALVYVPGVGHEVNGARRWIAIPLGSTTLTFQPSELAKWGVILVVAWLGAHKASQMRSFVEGLAPTLLIAGLIAAIITLEDFGTGALIVAVTGILLLAAGARLIHLLALAPLGVFALGLAILARPYRLQRLLTFLDPFEDPSGSGYHMIQSMIAVANGQVWGRGLGFGLQKFGYLPEDRTDFVFAVITEELGVTGALLVICLYLTLLWTGWRIVRREREVVTRLIGLGVLSTLGLQAALNLAVVTGLGPTKGIALPLLSAGGTGWILTAGSLGLLIGMDRRQRHAHAAARLAESTAQMATVVESKPAPVHDEDEEPALVVVTRPVRPAPHRAKVGV